MGSMRTITFYSYKGGVGRTLAAANFAVYLAKLGLKTVVIDFDLEAPGIDAKFPLLKVPAEQKGILDYILNYQLNNEDPGSVKQICLQVPIESLDNTLPLWLIPAGQYLSEEYYRKLSQLDWSFIFSEERDGVAFFQQFLAHIKQELKADFVIIDSRTGITEIAGLCTQQLADEVVMLSSLSSESIRVTKHIKYIIQQSKIAKALGKSIDVKVVVTRVPKPEDLETFKRECCANFETEETKLFFLFSSPDLERKEFIAIIERDKDEELFSNYVRLFYGLNIELADQNIRAEIKQLSSSLLLISPEESEKKILELAATYPHPEAYRTAIHFFSFTRKDKEMTNFAWKLFELLPDDEEVQNVLAKRYLDFAKTRSRLMTERARTNAIRAIEPLWQRGKLNSEEIKLYAVILADAEQYSKSLEVVLSLCEDDNLDAEIQVQLRLIAVRSASKLGQDELAEKLALSAVDISQEANNSIQAFETTKELLQQYCSYALLERAVSLAEKLYRVEELEELLESSEQITKLGKESEIHKLLEVLGLHKLAAYYLPPSNMDLDDIPF